MSGVFDISVMTDFAASHIIHGHPGKCARLHGHNWKVEACVRIPSDSLNEIGIGIDFIHEFFKIDNKTNNLLSSSIFSIIGKNKILKKYANLIADKGINI